VAGALWVGRALGLGRVQWLGRALGPRGCERRLRGFPQHAPRLARRLPLQRAAHSGSQGIDAGARVWWVSTRRRLLWSLRRRSLRRWSFGGGGVLARGVWGGGGGGPPPRGIAGVGCAVF